MILLDVKNYIRQHRHVSASQLKNKFHLTEDALAGMIERLLQQGFIQLSDGNSCSTGTCRTDCVSNETQYYWTGRKTKKLDISIELK